MNHTANPSAPMDAPSLIADLLAMPYRVRLRKLLQLGRTAATDAPTATLLRHWETGNWQERQWALLACYGSRDGAVAARLVADPSRSVARLAIHLLAIFGEDEQVVAALSQLPLRRQNRLLLRLRSRKRTALVDRFVREAQARNDAAGARHQALASAAPAQSESEAFDVVSCQRRAASRPTETVESLVLALQSAEQPDGLLFRAAQVALETLLSVHPDLALRLVAALQRHVSLSQLPLIELARHRPGEVADLVLASTSPVYVNLTSVVSRLNPDQRLALLERVPDTLSHPVSWLRELPALERARLFERFGPGWRDRDGCLPLALVGSLPPSSRHEEARRHLCLPLLRTRPLTAMAYCACLPWDEAIATLQTWFQHPEADMRAGAWRALSGCLRYHGDRLAEFVALLRVRKFEQDPVRRVFLAGLGGVQVTRWRAEHLPELAGVIREALDAMDLSALSVNELAKFLWRVLPHQPEWAAEQLGIVFRERGPVYCMSLQNLIDDETAVRMEAALLPVYESWTAVNRAGWLVWMCTTLGVRLRACHRLCAELRKLAFLDRECQSMPAVALLWRHQPAEESDRLGAELIARDPSWAATSLIFQFLFRRRQDLLGPFLRQPTLSGRHGRSDLIALLPKVGHWRLTIPQQQTLSTTLGRLTDLPTDGSMPKDSWTLLRAIDCLSWSPVADHARLTLLSSDVRMVVRDAALRALGRLDATQGLSVLLEALGDDRARVAIYALRASIADLPGERVLGYLRDVAFRKVTVAKEVLRLVGEFGGATAFSWLVEVAQRDLHRDVRIALLRALWDHLEHPEVWPILNAAAAETDGRLLDGVVRIPGDNLSAPARTRLVELLRSLTAHPEPTVRVAVLRRFAELPVPDPLFHLLDCALPLLSSPLPDERTVAASAVLAMATPAAAERIAATTGRLLPSREPLAAWLQTLTSAVRSQRERLAEVGKLVFTVLQTDPLMAGWHPSLTIAVDGLAGLRNLVRSWRATPEMLHVDAMEMLKVAISGVHEPDTTSLEELELEWANDSDARLRRLAVCALVAVGRSRGWTPGRRQRLEQYRKDASAMVASAAQFVFPPVEA